VGPFGHPGSWLRHPPPFLRKGGAGRPGRPPRRRRAGGQKDGNPPFRHTPPHRRMGREGDPAAPGAGGGRFREGPTGPIGKRGPSRCTGSATRREGLAAADAALPHPLSPPFSPDPPFNRRRPSPPGSRGGGGFFGLPPPPLRRRGGWWGPLRRGWAPGGGGDLRDAEGSPPDPGTGGAPGWGRRAQRREK